MASIVEMMLVVLWLRCVSYLCYNLVIGMKNTKGRMSAGRMSADNLDAPRRDETREEVWKKLNKKEVKRVLVKSLYPAMKRLADE